MSLPNAATSATTTACAALASAAAATMATCEKRRLPGADGQKPSVLSQMPDPERSTAKELKSWLQLAHSELLPLQTAVIAPPADRCPTGLSHLLPFTLLAFMLLMSVHHTSCLSQLSPHMLLLFTQLSPMVLLF